MDNNINETHSIIYFDHLLQLTVQTHTSVTGLQQEVSQLEATGSVENIIIYWSDIAFKDDKTTTVMKTLTN